MAISFSRIVSASNRADKGISHHGRLWFAFSSRAIERFVARHRDLVHRGSTFQLMGADEKAQIIARARELVATRKCSLHLITQELARETGRAVETIRYTLRRFDREHPDLALFDRAEQPHPIDEDTVIYDAYAGPAHTGDPRDQKKEAKKETKPEESRA